MKRGLGALRRGWMLYHLADEHFAFMYDDPPAEEWVALDCETTGLDVRHDQIVSIGAVRIVGNRLLTSQRLGTARAARALAQRGQHARAPAA
jgi:DNA polymerase-3 subunit epsilon